MSKMSELSIAVEGLRTAADALIATAESLTALFSSNSDEEPITAPPNEPTTTKAKKSEPKPKPLTLAAVRAVLAEKSRAGHPAEVRALLEKHGAEKLSEIDPSEYSAL